MRTSLLLSVKCLLAFHLGVHAFRLSLLPRSLSRTHKLHMAATLPTGDELNVDTAPLRVGVIGAGRIGQVHAENLAFKVKNAALAGVASGTKALADRCSVTFGCQPYYDYHELLEDPNIDAVIICSASNQHTKQMKDAAKAGKAIFVEKPIDTDLASIDSALLAIKEANVPLMVGFNRRFDRNYARVRAAVERGEIGEPHLFHIVSRDPSPPPIEYVKVSGGIWLDCTVHDFDMARFLLKDDVEEVMAFGACRVDPGIGAAGDVDTSLVTLKFKSGVIGTIDNSRKAVYGYDQRCEVFGSKGSCSINNNYANSAVLSTGSEIKRDLPLHFFMDRYEDAFQEEMQQFVDAVRMKKPLPCTGLDGRAPVVIAYAAKKSYLENRPVKISEVDVPMPPSLVGWNGQVQY